MADVMSDKYFYCTLHGETWQKLPDDAEILTKGRGGNGHVNVYRFVDGRIHFIKKLAVKPQEESK